MNFNQIEDGGLSEAIQSRLAIKGAAPAPTLAPEIFPVAQIGNVFGVDTDYKLGWRRYAAAVGINAVATEFPIMALLLDQGTNVIAVVERIEVLTLAVAEEVRVAWATGVPLSGTNAAPLDSRLGPTSSSTVRIRTGGLVAAPTPTSQFIHRLNPAHIRQMDTEIVILPNATPLAIWVNSSAGGNFQLRVVFRERAANAGELG